MKNLPDKIEVGKTYKLHHYRFGNAAVKILSVTIIKDEYKPYLPIDAWIDIEVVSGVLQGINHEWHPGDQKTVRQSHCTFSPNAALCESAGREKASKSSGTGCAPSDSHQ